MANEAVLIVETTKPINFTCADGTGIEKGALVKVSDPMTAALSAAQYDMIAGVVASEKIASNGVTKVSVYRDGIFRFYASGSVSVGDAVCSYADASFPNYVGTAKGKVAASGSSVLGLALETAAAGETFLVELRIGAGGVNNHA